MPRPRKDSAEPAARQRIKDAFWELYLELPFDKVTVKEICARAGCNKTSFYYHFEGAESVLREIEDECMPVDAPDFVVEAIRSHDHLSVEREYFISHGENFDRMCHLLGPKGDPAFAKQAKDIMTEKWCESLGVNRTQLGEQEKLLVEFIMGGTVSLLAARGEGRPIGLHELGKIVAEMIEPHLIRLLKTNEA